MSTRAGGDTLRFVLGRILTTALVAMLLAACSSVPDIHFDGDGGGIDPNCKPTGREICDDGIDNDCDGATDCQDSECTGGGFACQDAPEGWTPVAFAGSGQPTCPSGETSTDLKVATGDGSATCSCTCTSVGGSCAGNLTVVSAADVACTTTPATTSVPPNVGGCTALPSSISLSTRAKVAPPTPPTACTPKQVLNGPLTSGRLCQAPQLGKGCSGTQVCAPKPTTGLDACVTKPGKSACPAGFGKRNTAGTSANESRSCSGCNCGAPTPCSGGSVDLFDNAMCKTNGNFKHANGIGTACDGLSPDSGFTATHFTSTGANGGCGAPTSQATATGTLAFADERTVCCK